MEYTGRASFLATFGGGTQASIWIDPCICAAGSVFGVAKSARIIGIKCKDNNGAGSTANIISAINLAGNTAVSTGRPSVVSVSLRGAANQAIDDAAVNSVNLGIPFGVAVGNSTADVSTSNPVRLGGPSENPSVITAGFTNTMDAFVSLSNFGLSLGVLEIGQDVLSCGITSDDAVQSRSGTSASKPHVAWLAAPVTVQEGKLTPAALKQRIVPPGASGVINGIPALTANTLGNNGASFA